ncbi:hypothetical protein [Winogradskyella aurantia]|uniref:hypothetical protein n=1 Tax=Winogradskyella aurantia TaxID=1915063 RepID=UPI0013FDC965|nr:hypothetical protein [Winogradskyella aurantia]
MRTLKITIALAAIVLFAVSGVQSDKVMAEKPTYEEYSPKDLLAVDKRSLRVKSQG